ncbi:hypothetical protein OIO90_004669 [Microbotryomycetes sp. JL221]|nr:hypothetical protein OIO90_004669 [Microbotryomycetes sp. JL221]
MQHDATDTSTHQDASSNTQTSFSCSNDAFRLRRPTPQSSASSTASSASSSMIMNDTRSAPTLESHYPLFGNRRSRAGVTVSAATSSLVPPIMTTPSHRKLSMLGGEPMLPPTQCSPSPPASPFDDATDNLMDDISMRTDTPPNGTQTEEPTTNTTTTTMTTRDIATTANSSNDGTAALSAATMATSPLAVARALRERHPPAPFLQRRLFTNKTAIASSDEQLTRDESSNTDESGDVSTSDVNESQQAFGVVRRAVSRKPNLLPKTKSHLRVLSQLHAESSIDLAEVMSEAALHRLTMSSSMPPTRMPSNNHSSPSSSTTNHMTSRTFPLGNRFPETVTDDDDEQVASDSSIDEELEDISAVEATSESGAMSVSGYMTEDEDERRSALWRQIRNGSNAGPNSTRSPGPSERARNELDQPHTPSTMGSSGRPGKRKTTDDRFEPYSSMFNKRRAVSPAALSPGAALASPLLSFTHANVVSTPPLSFTSSATTAIPMTIPSAILNPGPRNSSRATSPTASSLSSSTGRTPGHFMSLAMATRERETLGDEAGDGLRNMSLG